MLRGGVLDAAATARALEVIESNAKAQAQLVEDLLDMSRIVTGRLRLEVEPVALAPVVAAALESMRPAADAKGVEVATVIPADTGAVSGDPGRLQQVVWNLLSNAVKFTPRGGRVELSVQSTESEVELVVRDTGKGIDPEFLPFVFDRFRQADGAPTRLHGGFGLGLAIVRHLVELHGGSVHAESAGTDRGATMTVRLPRRAPEAGSTAELTPPGGGAAARGRLHGRRLLVVDDDVDTCQALGAVLRRAGAEVRLGDSAAAAMAMLSEWRPDVLISDVGLPDEDGYALVQKIRALPPAAGGDVPAIALTGYSRAEDRMRGLVAGFQRHLVKPVEPDELVDVVASVAAERASTPVGADASARLGGGASAGVDADASARVESARPLDPARRPPLDRVAINDAVAFVSHELRQPLAAIRIWLNLLEADLGDALNDESRAHLAQIRASVTWMGELIAGRLAEPPDPSA
jgi:signal transduction histidine kinase